ncbi:hypothetical protein DM01DRAFT_1410277 [Hesseltinella vesiculosa]|uniref:Mediator of RNA polymerase II transcription subunit 11 n=1 Tax=Hesseltinella vesiculosa TaxID=101127 RepID=A0A1X2G7L4_9FUNG|nr:hypothetical protein DM01DRAFT_1410277 [Hesseltinella vesiculosa]
MSESDESVSRIQDLHITEKKLVSLVETAGHALALLADDGPSDEDADLAVHERTTEFRDLATRYFSLINDIQLSVRQHTHFLTQTASLPCTTKTIPYRVSVAGEQRELEIWINALQLIQQRLTAVQQSAQINPN